jgi:hypothetical protein
MDKKEFDMMLTQAYGKPDPKKPPKKTMKQLFKLK